MSFNDKTKKVICAVLAVALGLPIVISVVSMFVM